LILEVMMNYELLNIKWCSTKSTNRQIYTAILKSSF